jgi:hypothetical protein
MKKTLLAALTLALVIGGATAVFAAVDDQRAPTAATTTVEDIPGPCDEAEHANDPRCTDGNVRDDDAADHRGRDDENEVREPEMGEDIPGPCDEAEHANDPQCTAAVPGDQPAQDEDADDRGDAVDDDPGEVDNSGPGSQNSGPGSENSGPGSINSGPSGHADDEGDESGHGGSGESGHGGGGEGDDD